MSREFDKTVSTSSNRLSKASKTPIQRTGTHRPPSPSPLARVDHGVHKARWVTERTGSVRRGTRITRIVSVLLAAALAIGKKLVSHEFDAEPDGVAELRPIIESRPLQEDRTRYAEKRLLRSPTVLVPIVGSSHDGRSDDFPTCRARL